MSYFQIFKTEIVEKLLTYCFQILNIYKLNSLQVIISVIYKALAVLGEVQQSQPTGDDVVHPGVA